MVFCIISGRRAVLDSLQRGCICLVSRLHKPFENGRDGGKETCRNLPKPVEVVEKNLVQTLHKHRGETAEQVGTDGGDTGYGQRKHSISIVYPLLIPCLSLAHPLLRTATDCTSGQDTGNTFLQPTAHPDKIPKTPFCNWTIHHYKKGDTQQ